MDGAEFRALITDPRLQLLFDYWHRIKQDRSMPDWADLRPEEIAPVLPVIWAWRFDENGDFRLRLAGELIAEVLEVNIRGKTPFDLYTKAAAQGIDERFRKVITDPTCSFSAGPVNRDSRAVGFGQRLVLPYEDRKAGRRGVIGASTLEKYDRANPANSTLYELVGNEYFLPLS